MGKSSDSFLEAMQIMVDASIEKLKFDKTIQANIVSVENVDTGEYKVKYQDAIFLAYANDITKSYKTGDLVFVTIPEGDFSNKKLIQSKITQSSLSYNEMTELQNSIVEKSPTFEILYGPGSYNPSNSYGVIAGAAQGGDIAHSIASIYQQNTYVADNNNLFRQYAEEYEYIRLQGSFLTQLHYSYTSGNYGLKVEFWCKSTSGQGVSSVTFTLDISNFNGRLYALTTYSPQTVIIKVAKGYLLGLKSIELFEQMPCYDHWTDVKTSTTYQNTNTANIFVKDIFLQFVDKIDLSQVEYYLNINTPQGQAFTSSLSSLDLIGSLIHRGQNILNESTCSCQWFERDVTIGVGDVEYYSAVGPGWKPISGETSNILSLSNSDVYLTQEYNLLVTYNESVIVTAQKKIYNNTHDVDFQLEQLQDNNRVYLQITNPSFLGNWYVSFVDGRYEQLALLARQVEITSLLDYGNVVVHCAGYDNNNHYLGTIDYQLIDEEEESAFTITYSGQDTYRYDANGDIDPDEAEKQRQISATIVWKDDQVLPYQLQWNVKINGVITPVPQGYSSALNPDNSMMRNIYVDTSNKLCYYIKQRYRQELTNNTLYLYLTVSGAGEQLLEKEILFLKDGDQGTNGTSYVVVVRPCNRTTGAKVQSYEDMVLRYNDNAQQWITNNLPLRCYVYKDGELISDSPNYTISYKWDTSNIALTTTTGTPIASGDSITNSIVLASGNGNFTLASNSIALEHWVKVQVSITNGPSLENGRPIEIYTSYPIDIVVGQELPSKYDLSDIPQYIKYNSSGLNAQFSSHTLTWSCHDLLYPDDENISSNIMVLQSKNTNLLTIKDRSGSRYLDPASSFIYEKNTSTDSNIGVLVCIYNSNAYVIRSVIMYLNQYSNAAINGWDGTSIETEDGHIFAPQIGAGGKDSQNRFTGVVMGKDSGQQKIGLYGYQNGVTTFGLMEDGKAFFGAKSGGGQIVVDGTTATIYGGDSSATHTAANGMILTLADRSVSGTTKAIRVGNDKFTVDYNGDFIAQNGSIYGQIYAESGKIGSRSPSSPDGWNITANKIYNRNITLYSGQENDYKYGDSGDYYRLWAGSDNTHPNDARFFVTNFGKMKATNAEISGTGSSGNGYIGLSSNGQYAIWAGNSVAANAPFSVTHAGAVTASNLTVTGGSITGTSIVVARQDGRGQILMDGTTFTMQALIDGVMKDRIYFDAIRGDYVFDGALGADAVFTDALYAEMGIVAELTVDELSTSRRIRKYFLQDYSDDNFVHVKDQYTRYITGTIVSSTGLLTEDGLNLLTESGLVLTEEVGAAATEQAVNRYGQGLYWQQEPVSHTNEGYPLDEHGKQVYATTTVTNWPVVVFKYTYLVKKQDAFDYVGQNYIPQSIYGAGDENGNSKGYIYKDENSFKLRYVSSARKNVDITFSDEGFVDAMHRRLKSIEIDSLNGSVLYELEGSDALYSLSFVQTEDSATFTWPDGFECEVNVI